MTKTNKTMLLQSSSNAPLKLCESFDPANNKKKYIFEGIFTACSTDKKTIINRNNRIYRDTEVLRHLPYLRQLIKDLGGILGEPAHPDARFDTKIVEASHIIRDLHWVPEDAVVWGRLELLDTPAGDICKTIWDAGYKLSVSSRAAGEVDPQTHEVRIELIFTYDIVPQGGFSQAILNKVSESKELDMNCHKYINESLSSTIKEDSTVKVIAEGLVCKEMNESVPENAEAKAMLNKPLDMEDLCKPLYESEDANECDKTDVKTTDECKTTSEENEFKLPSADLNPTTVQEDDNENNEEKPEDNSDDTSDNSDEKKTLTDDEKAEKRKKILSIEAVDSEGKTNTESEKEEKRSQILDVESKPEESDDKEDSEDTSDSKELSDITDDTKPEEECGGNNVENAEECDNSSYDTNKTEDVVTPEDAENSIPNDIKVKDAKKTALEVKDKALNDKEKAEDIKTLTKDDMDKYVNLLKKAKKLADVKESIVKLYPFSISMSDENFAQFAALKSGDKNKVQKYIMEHNIFSISDINEQWKTPLLEEKRQLKNWLRLASEEDKRLFAAAPMDVQDAIEESAKYVMIQTKLDADNFWNKTGLRQAAAHKIINESMQNRYNVVENETGKNDSVLNENAINLGYSMNYFKMLEDMY